MASRPKGTRSFVFDRVSGGAGLADQHLKTDGAGNGVEGILYSFEIQWSGLTVGDQIHIHDIDTAAGDATAVKRYSFTVPTTAGSYTGSLPAVGIEFLKGLWLNGQLTGANPLMTLVIGFD